MDLSVCQSAKGEPSLILEISAASALTMQNIAMEHAISVAIWRILIRQPKPAPARMNPIFIGIKLEDVRFVAKLFKLLIPKLNNVNAFLGMFAGGFSVDQVPISISSTDPFIK